MRTLRYIILALLFLMLIVVVIGFFLPSKVHLERSVIINRDKATIFKVINSLSEFNKWSPWYELDINANYTLSGPQSGIGSKLEWQGNEKVGTGSNEIIKSSENLSITSKYFFGKSEQPAISQITLLPQDKKTKVVWAFDNDFGYNVFYRYFGLVLEDMIAPDYEKGLKQLKAYVESLPLYDYSNISIVITESAGVYAYTGQAKQDQQNISTEIAKAYEKIITFLTQNNIARDGTPIIISLKNESDVFDFIVAIPVKDNSVIDSLGLIQSLQTYKGKAIKLTYKGSKGHFQKNYKLINAYMTQNHLQSNGNSWEDFIPDSTEEDVIIHIYQPIK